MVNFTYKNATEIVFGKGTQSQTGELLKRYGGKKALLHYGGGSIKRAACMTKSPKALKKRD